MYFNRHFTFTNYCTLTRFIYVFNCPEGPGLDCPFLVDYSGIYFRREGMGGNYIAGTSPEEVWSCLTLHTLCRKTYFCLWTFLSNGRLAL